MRETQLVSSYLFELYTVWLVKRTWILWPQLSWLLSKSPSLSVSLLKVGSQRWCGMPGVERVRPGLCPRWPPTAWLEAAHSSVWYVFSRCFKLWATEDRKSCIFLWWMQWTFHRLMVCRSGNSAGVLLGWTNVIQCRGYSIKIEYNG